MKTVTRKLLQELEAARPVLVSPDGRLATELNQLLTELHAGPAVWFDSFSRAERELPSLAGGVVFLDLRRTSEGDEPTRLLAQLAGRNGNRTPVITIGDSTYRRSWAIEADVAVHATLHFPFNRVEFGDLLESEKLARVVSEATQLVKPRIIEVGSFRYMTYTPSMYEMLDHLERVAAHDVTLLLVGETGTGKTTIARLVHELSSHRGEPFLTVACGSLPRELIESELFGHVRGAFTSADRTKLGKFDAVGRGSLLLDEIDVLGPVQQTKLLRVIETGEYEAVGSNETRVSQARLIVASNVDLKEMMQREEFRPDLYYRLNVLEFHVPALCERPQDIVPLTLGFVDEFSLTHKINIEHIHPGFLAALKNYDWPGNIRELKNHIRRAVLFCQNGELTVQDLALGLLKPKHPTGNAVAGGRPESATLSQRVAMNEQEMLEAALRANGYRRTATAQALGISRVGLYKKMRKYGMLGTQRARTTSAPMSSMQPPEPGATAASPRS